MLEKLLKKINTFIDADHNYESVSNLGLDSITLPVAEAGITIVRRKIDRRVLTCLKKRVG